MAVTAISIYMGGISPEVKTRRVAIGEMIRLGRLLPVKQLAIQFGTSERSIERDLTHIRSNKGRKLDIMINDEMVTLFFEIFQGYYTDVDRLDQLSRFEVRTSRDREVQSNIIGLMCDKRKDQLLMLMKGPIVWNLDRIAKSGKTLNLEKAYPKAIYGEKQTNTHIDLGQQPSLTYNPPNIEKDGGQ